MPKHKHSSVSRFGTLSLVVIFSFSLLHDEWWQAATCVAALVLLANLPYILKGNVVGQGGGYEIYWRREGGGCY